MTPLELSEEELLQRAGRGDSRAFERLQDALAPRLHGLLLSLLRDEREAAEQLVQGFVQLWEQAASYQPERGSAQAWVITLFRQRAIERMRVLGRRNRLVDPAVFRETTLEVADISDHHAGSLQDALGRLPVEQRDLIVGAFLKGLNHHVMAESLGMPSETLKNHIRRGLLSVRAHMKGESV